MSPQTAPRARQYVSQPPHKPCRHFRGKHVRPGFLASRPARQLQLGLRRDLCTGHTYGIEADREITFMYVFNVKPSLFYIPMV